MVICSQFHPTLSADGYFATWTEISVILASVLTYMIFRATQKRGMRKVLQILPRDVLRVVHGFGQ